MVMWGYVLMSVWRGVGSTLVYLSPHLDRAPPVVHHPYLSSPVKNLNRVAGISLSHIILVVRTPQPN